MYTRYLGAPYGSTLSKVNYFMPHSRAVHTQTYKLVRGLMAVTREGDQGVTSKSNQE